MDEFLVITDAWCDYQANFSSNIRRLRSAGIEILLNADGAHKFTSLAFVTGSAGVRRMVELALALNASVGIIQCDSTAMCCIWGYFDRLLAGLCLTDCL